MVVRRGCDGTDPLVCPVGCEAQVECTVRTHLVGDRRYAMGDTRSFGVHVLRFGNQHHCLLYARPWRIGDSDQPDRYEYYRRVFPYPSWSRDLCRGGWHAVYVAL